MTAARVRMLLDFDRSADLAHIRQPTLVIGARDDALIPIHHARRLNTLMPLPTTASSKAPTSTRAPIRAIRGTGRRFLAATSNGGKP